MTANDESAQRLDSLRTASKLLFRSGLVTVIGSGWSCGKGLPSMSKLADACATQVPLSEFFGDLDDAGISDWATFSEELSTSGDFEQTMNSVSNGSLLLQIIENVIVAAVSDAEAPAIEAIVAGEPKSTDLTRFITWPALRIRSRYSPQTMTDSSSTQHEWPVIMSIRCSAVTQLGA